jgi:hypothetical protein
MWVHIRAMLSSFSIRTVWLLALCGTAYSAMAQSDSSSVVSRIKNIEVSGYLEFYGAYDDIENDQHRRPEFLYHYTRTGELALNIGYLKAAWNQGSVRTNIALMAGSYAERNLATEPKNLQHIYEANIGVKVSKSKNIWLDLGVLPSHIGLESAIGKDNSTLTRSLVAENTPYYETGIRLSYNSASEKLKLVGLLLNGWQRMYKLDGDYFPAFGAQAVWTPSAKFNMNYSFYLGDESPESDFGARIFHNFFFNAQPTEKIQISGCFDFGTQPDVESEDWNTQQWYGWLGVFKYALSPKSAIALRAEQYADNNEVIVINPYDDGFKTTSFSLNVDHNFNKHLLLRGEGRLYHSANYEFEKRNGDLTQKALAFTAALAVSF